MTSRVNIKRTLFKGGETGPGPVVYWMSRDQRVQDNWALLYAQDLALETRQPLMVLFCLAAPNFLKATPQMYDFMLPGLWELEVTLKEFDIPFFQVKGQPEIEVPDFLKRVKAGALVTDFNPLKISRDWKEGVRQKTTLSYFVVDAHNIVPCWVASGKQEFGAYTLRPKIYKLLPEYLEEFPKLKKHPFHWRGSAQAVNSSAGGGIGADKDQMRGKAEWLLPGEKAAKSALMKFLKERLVKYDEGRNDPSFNGQSDLSPYLHFGQISAQRVALEVQKSLPMAKTEAFLEELIVRRELADNFCFYNKNYDNFDGFPSWARETLNAHRKDPRPYFYSKENLEKGLTHDIYWNAAQIQMVKTGKMHGYMRMYWAKKILEWTKSPDEAQEIAIELNDRYELDGRDPNGYTGIAWSIGGVHDRPWTERPIFGKIRYMNAKGLDRKFNMERYVSQWDNKSSLF